MQLTKHKTSQNMPITIQSMCGIKMEEKKQAQKLHRNSNTIYPVCPHKQAQKVFLSSPPPLFLRIK